MQANCADCAKRAPLRLVDCQNIPPPRARACDCRKHLCLHVVAPGSCRIRSTSGGLLISFLSCYSNELAIVLALWCKRRQSALLALVRHILALASVLYTRASWLDSPSQPVSDKNSGIHARCNKRHHHLSGYLREQLRLFKTEIINQLTQIVSDCPTLIYLVPSSR